MKSCLNLLLIPAALFIGSCQDTVKVSVPSTAPVLAVDGWITDRSGGDTITLYKTQTYFDNSRNNVVTGALLSVSSGSKNEDLKEVLPGKYRVRRIRATQGANITLHINTSGSRYEATTQIARTSPVLDSVKFQYQAKSPIFDTAGYYVYLFGQEIPGIGDYVQIKFYINGVLQNFKEDLNVLSDQFTNGKYLNGFRIAQRSPFKRDQKVWVETWSLSADDYNFYADIRTQINNQGIFSRTPVNVRTNLIALGGAPAVTGYFGGSLVHRYSTTVY